MKKWLREVGGGGWGVLLERLNGGFGCERAGGSSHCSLNPSKVLGLQGCKTNVGGGPV